MELRTLLDECSSREGNILKRKPNEDSPVQYAAWEKVEQVMILFEPFLRDYANLCQPSSASTQVYGYGSLNTYLGQGTAATFASFTRNVRVNRLLTPSSPGAAFNSVYIKEGSVTPGSMEALQLLNSGGDHRLMEKRKQWARRFRANINSYVLTLNHSNIFFSVCHTKYPTHLIGVSQGQWR